MMYNMFTLRHRFSNRGGGGGGGLNHLPYSVKVCNNIKIMPCVEGDRSDCKPEASSIARSRRPKAVVVVEG